MNNISRLLEFFKKVEMVDKVPTDCVIVVCLAKGYDVGGDNEFWKLEANKSQIRDVVCFYCKNEVVMSNKAYGDYISNDRKNKVACIGCLNKDLAKNQSG